ncbi:hypothetical protein [Kribbella sp.]|uniref:hypothetical protein n=1 Tax=Kribbella sp. TaxID=1871183 RepID=UPI002D281A71|nr:hypothetical protein [Kribbella sp.]HZX04413.1 hypothetical protein [Kribbella sp.]
MAEVPVSKAAAQFVDAWEAAVRERLVEKPPQRYDRRVLLGPYASPEKHRHGLLAVGTGGGDAKGRIDIGDGKRLHKLGVSTSWRRDRSWPTGSEVAEVQRLGVALSRELSAGAVRPYSHEPEDRDARKLADAVGTAVGRFHYSHIVTHLASAKTISPEVEQALRSGNDFAQRTPKERLVEAFAGTLDPAERRNPADGRLLDRMHASEQADKARVAAEILVNRSPVLQQTDPATRAAATELLREAIRTQLGRAIDDLERPGESRTSREERADGLGRRIGEDVQRAVGRLEADAAPEPDAEVARTAETDSAVASRLAGDGVAGAVATVPGETGTSSTAADASKASTVRKASQGTTLG